VVITQHVRRSARGKAKARMPREQDESERIGDSLTKHGQIPIDHDDIGMPS